VRLGRRKVHGLTRYNRRHAERGTIEREYIMTTRITSKDVHAHLQYLKEELIDAGVFTIEARWDVQESSATYGRAWRVYVNEKGRLPLPLASQLGGSSGYLGDTAKEALETIKGARRLLRAIVETREETERGIVEQLAALGIPVASLARGFMDSGLTFSESIAASVALAS
jgi:hypothetical protein